MIVQKLAEVLNPPAVVALVPAAPRGILARASSSLLAAALRHAPEILLGKPLMPDREEMTRLQLNNLPPAERDRVYGLQVPESGRQTFDTRSRGSPWTPQGWEARRLQQTVLLANFMRRLWVLFMFFLPPGA